MPWTAQPVAVIDFEGSLATGVLEYGVVVVVNGKIAETQTRLCRSTGTVPASDTAIHGLDGTEAAEPFASEWERFATLRERGPLAAHFAGVENALIRAAWPLARSSPDFAGAGRTTNEWGPWIDTARLADHFVPNPQSLNLESLITTLGLTSLLREAAAQYCPTNRRRFHCALHDALASGLILCALAREPKCSALSLQQVLALSTLDPKKRETIVQERLF